MLSDRQMCIRDSLCTLHYTRQDKLEADVLAVIQLQVKAALNYDLSLIHIWS